MPLFDAYIMVDWSGSDRRRAGQPGLHLDCTRARYSQRADYGEPAVEDRSGADHPRAASVDCRGGQRSRAALRRLRLWLPCRLRVAAARRRLAASCRPGASSGSIWAKHVQDDLGTKPGQRPTNRSNRFEVASAINAAVSSSASPVHSGVFSKPVVTLAFRRKGHRSRSSAPAELSLRFVSRTGERRAILRSVSSAPAASAAKCSPASRDSTAIRFDPQFARCSAVWPFETGWAPATGTWLDPDLRIVHAEIYPSVRAPLTDSIKDRGQVRAMWHWARDLDAKNLLINEFAIPAAHHQRISGGCSRFERRRAGSWVVQAVSR